jgi:hypothetical protein
MRVHRVIVCGGRDWSDVESVHSELRYLMSTNGTPMYVIHGACPTGADAIADAWAKDPENANWGCYGVRLKRYPADWNKHGKSAGPRRNQQMADDGAELCLAFWDGASRGTLDMITRAAKAGIPVRIVPPRRLESAKAGGGGG